MSYLSVIARLCWRNLTRLLLTLLAVALLTLLMAWRSYIYDPFPGCTLDGDVVVCE